MPLAWSIARSQHSNSEPSSGSFAGDDPQTADGFAYAGPVSALAAALEAERHRWFLWVPVLVGVGIGGYFALPYEPGVWLAASILFACATLAWLVRDGTLAYAMTRALLATAIGFTVIAVRTEWVAAPVIERTIQRAEISGFVELVEVLAARGQRLTIRVTAIAGLDTKRLPRRVRIRIMNPQPGIGPGDAIALSARLSPPGEPVLPGGYDFARRAWFLGIGGVGFTFQPPKLVQPLPGSPEAQPPWSLRVAAAIERVRLAIGAAVTTALPGQSGAIANAMLTGDRGGITPDTDKAFRDSGLTHILSISGLHMTVMAGTLFVAVRLLLAAIPGLAVRFPVKIWAAAIAMFGALGYLLISGGAFATLRSYVMITIIFFAMIVERPALSMRNVALAALALLIVWPESLLDPGFQMSFAAVAALLAAYEGWQRRADRLGHDTATPHGPAMRAARFVTAIMASTLIAGLAVAPLAAYHFHTSQQYSILGNVLALPICDLLVMPALLATLLLIPLGLEAYPLMLAGWGIDGMTAIARYVGGLPGAVAAIPSISLTGLLAMAVGGLWLIIWTGRWRVAGLIPIAAGVIIAPMDGRPDILISRDGSLVVARVDGRFLSAAPTPVTKSVALNPLPNAAVDKPSSDAFDEPSGDTVDDNRREPPVDRSGKTRGDGRQRGSGERTRRPPFELTRWLEADGDGRPPQAPMAGRGFVCDTVGCTATIAGKRLSILHHRSGATDDCRTADILVTAGDRPRICDGPRIILDRKSLRDGGAHALSISPSGAIVLDTISASRGARPWVTGRSQRAAPPRHAIADQSNAAGNQPEATKRGEANHSDALRNRGQSGVDPTDPGDRSQSSEND